YEMGMEAGLAKGRIEGIRQGEERGKIIGRVEGAIKSLQKLGQNKEATISYIREEFQLTKKEAEKYVSDYWEDF
ncbi:MAG: hypothetical protein NC086_09330, partial [Alistipes sp.]|nr:hypothetical protein [Alistipes sp.]